MLTYKTTLEKKISLENYKEKIKTESEYISKYIQLTETHINKTEEELANSLQKEIENNPNSQSQINNFYETEFSYIASFYHQSSILLTHSFLENSLQFLCRLIQSETNSKFDISSLKGQNYIYSTFEYLKLMTNLSEDLINKYKPQLSKYQKLRNIITHTNSTCKNDNEKTSIKESFNTKIKFIDDGHKFIITSNKLSLDYLNCSSKLLNEILIYIDSISFAISHRNNTNDLPF